MTKQILLVGNPLNTPRKIDHWRAMIDEHVRTSNSIHYLQVGGNVTDDSLDVIAKLGAIPVRPFSGRNYLISPRRLESVQSLFVCYFPSLAYSSLKRALNVHFSGKPGPDFLLVLPGLNEVSLVGYTLAKHYNLKMLVLDQFSYYQRKILTRQKLHIINKVCGSSSEILFKCQRQRSAFEGTFNVESKTGLWPDPIPFQFEIPPLEEGVVLDIKKSKAEKKYLFAAWSNWTRSLKRLDLLLDAFQLVSQGNRCASLIVAGPLPSNVSSASKKMSNSNIRFLGDVDRQTVKALAYNVDCAVVPSDFETFSLPTLEALVGGTPVIATACGGPEDIIQNPKIGTIVERGDVSSLATAMTRASEGLAGYGRRGWIRKNTLNRYSREAASLRWKKFYAATHC